MTNPVASYDLLADFKLAVRLTTTASDDIVQGELNAATRKLERCCRRSFWPVTETRTFDLKRESTLYVGDYRNIASIKLYGSATALLGTDYRRMKLSPDQPAYQLIQRVGPTGPIDWHSTLTLSPYGAAVVTADWGMEATVPIEAVLACRIVASRLLKKRGLLYLDSGGNDYGDGTTGDAAPLIDNTVLELIGCWVLPDLPYIMDS